MTLMQRVIFNEKAKLSNINFKKNCIVYFYFSHRFNTQLNYLIHLC